MIPPDVEELLPLRNELLDIISRYKLSYDQLLAVQIDLLAATAMANNAPDEIKSIVSDTFGHYYEARKFAATGVPSNAVLH